MGCDGIPSGSVQQSIANCNNYIAICDKSQEKSEIFTGEGHWLNLKRLRASEVAESLLWVLIGRRNENRALSLQAIEMLLNAFRAGSIADIREEAVPCRTDRQGE
jgi:hypothetical protein